VPAHRRGIAAGARVLVQNTGAVISIAFVLAVITSSVPETTLFRVFSGLANHISNHQLAPFISNMHTALWCLAAVSLLGAVVSAARPAHEDELDLGPAPAMKGSAATSNGAAAQEAEAAATEAAVLP
jgi:hypothetical protein